MAKESADDHNSMRQKPFGEESGSELTKRQNCDTIPFAGFSVRRKAVTALPAIFTDRFMAVLIFFGLTYFFHRIFAENTGDIAVFLCLPDPKGRREGKKAESYFPKRGCDVFPGPMNRLSDPLSFASCDIPSSVSAYGSPGMAGTHFCRTAAFLPPLSAGPFDF